MNALSILDMHRKIEQDIQTLAFFTHRDLDSEQIDLYINDEISFLVEGIVNSHFGVTPLTNERQGFQDNQISLDNLRTIHLKDVVRTIIPTTENDGIEFIVPDDYSHHIRTKVTIVRTCKENGKDVNKTTYANIRLFKSQYDARNHPFHKTDIESPLAELAGNKITVYTEGLFNITEVKLSYIRKPVVVKFGKDIGGNYDAGNSTNCDLDPTLHQIVVKSTSATIAGILQQPQQKVVNLQQKTI